MSKKNYDLGEVLAFGDLDGTYESNIITFEETCNKVAIMNETDAAIYINRGTGIEDAIAAGKSRSYVEWAPFGRASIKHGTTAPTSGFVSVQACYSDFSN